MKFKFIFLFAAVHVYLKSEVTIEKYKKSDFDNVSKLYPKCFPGLKFKDDSSIRTTIDRKHNISMDSHIYLLKENDNLLGCFICCVPSKFDLGSLSSWLSNYGFIADVCIDSDYRGKGYGKKVLKYAIDFLKGKGASVIYLTVDDCNEIAKSLYKSLGFKEIHPKDATSHYYELVIKDNYYHKFINNTRFYLDLASAATIAVALGVGITSAVDKAINYYKK